LPKCPTGIQGFDEITGGGLPKGRPSLLCGGAGCGKTLFGIEFLIRGALDFGEPGVFVSFDERAEDLTANVASLGFDLPGLVARKLLVVDYVRVERSEFEESGEYNLEGLFIRLGYAIDSVGAKRIVLDSIESLFAGLSNVALLRAELRRLFSWLKEKGVTAVITGERGDGHLTRHGLEEYISDCVVLLDHRVQGQISTRRLRIVKYRGSAHGTNEYPFLLDQTGMTVLPITSAGLDHKVSGERQSSGIAKLDGMLGGAGFFQGSSVLVTGTPGTGKSSVAAHFARATCAAGQKCLYFAFEESPSQIVRNMRSIGVNLEPAIKSGRLRVVASRPTLCGLETHLVLMYKQVKDHQPTVVIVDPLTSLTESGAAEDVTPMLLRLVDFLKERGITAMFTSLAIAGPMQETADAGVTSLMDTWLLLREIEWGGERNRGIYILKSRGMAHSNQIREFLITSSGITLRQVYLGPEGVLTGSARVAQEARECEQDEALQADAIRRHAETNRRRAVLAAQLEALRAELEALDTDRVVEHEQERSKAARGVAAKATMTRSRRGEVVVGSPLGSPLSGPLGGPIGGALNGPLGGAATLRSIRSKR